MGTASMPLHLLPSELAFLIPSPPRQLPLKTRLQTTPLEMLPAPTLSTCSWVLESQGLTFDVPVGSLGFSVTIFCLEALCAILILLARRHPAVGGELGGPKFFKTVSSSIFVFFWCFYVMISALEMYDVIDPGF